MYHYFCAIIVHGIQSLVKYPVCRNEPEVNYMKYDPLHVGYRLLQTTR
jgi:hypothetical protein